MYKTVHDKDSKLWKGYDVPPLYNPEISIAQILLKAMTINGTKVAQISDDSGIQITYDEIRTKTIRAAQNLRKRGFQSKEVYSFIVGNTDDLTPILFATFYNGCSVNGIDPSFKKFELIHMLGLIKPDLVFCDIEVYDLVSKCLIELENHSKIFTFGGCKDGSEAVEVLFNEIEPDDFLMLVFYQRVLLEGSRHVEIMTVLSCHLSTSVDGVNDIALITCSSGTTGISKGVSLSHAALINSIHDYPSFRMDDIIFSFSTIYWLGAWFFLLTGTFRGATRIITRKGFSPTLELSLIEKYKITSIFNTPYQVAMLLKNDQIDKTDLSTIKVLIVSGTKFLADTKTKMQNYLCNGTICNGYGMSEVAGYVACDFRSKPTEGQVGQILNGCHIKIIDENGWRCDVNTDGEICIKTKYKFLGYYGSPDATKELLDDEGFVKSGDIGHFDPEGNLYVVDRKKDIIKYCSFAIAPSEIEDFLIQSPAISSVCAVGIPDYFVTDLPAVVIVRNKNFNITEKVVLDMVSENFVDSRKLRGGVYFVDSLPTTPSGKVRRKMVREMAIELFKEQSQKQHRIVEY